MDTIDYKLDAILIALNSYYFQFANANDLNLCTGDASDLIDEFVGQEYISACLDFSEKGMIHVRKTELNDLLNHLEEEKLVISKIIDGEQKFKILTEGKSLIAEKGYVKKQKRLNKEYQIKIGSFWISIAAILISAATFIYTVFIKK